VLDPASGYYCLELNGTYYTTPTLAAARPEPWRVDVVQLRTCALVCISSIFVQHFVQFNNVCTKIRRHDFVQLSESLLKWIIVQKNKVLQFLMKNLVQPFH
jgi:hypothetical protein